MDVTDCTVVSNYSGFYHGGIEAQSLHIQNTIVAWNTNVGHYPDSADYARDLAGCEVLSGGFNLIGTTNFASHECVPGQATWQPTDQLGSFDSPLDPKLGPLADNGGPTPTHRPFISPLSRAIDKGNSAATTDQRGYPRPFDFGVPNPPGNTNDIGAVEVQECDGFLGLNCICLGCRTNPTLIGIPLGSPLTVAPTLPWPPCLTCPYSYQWLFNGANIAGATSNTFSLTNAQFNNAGTYSLVASNGSGAVTAAVASVTVGYSLSVGTASNNSARILFSPYQGVYAPGTTVTLTAVPLYGWAFDYWSGDVLSPYNPLPVFMNTNLSIIANLHYTNPPAGSQTIAQSPGTALSFDGVDDVMLIGGAALPAPWTAEFWVKRQDASTYSATLLGSTNAALKLEQYNFTRRVGFTRFGVADYAFNYSAPTGTWVHLAFVASNDTKLYVNGLLQDSTNATISLPLDRLGGDPVATDQLRGSIDEVRVWNYARTASDIQGNMGRSIAAPQPGLVAYWRLDEGSGLTATDASGLGHTGRLTNGLAWTASTIPFVPWVTTSNGIALNDTNAALSGLVNPNGLPTTNWFEYGASSNYSGITSPLTNSVSAAVSNIATRLPPGTLCHFRLAAMNSAGINFGQDATFLTPQRLRVAITNSNEVLLAWPLSLSSNVFYLQQNTNLSTTNWLTMTNVPVVVSNESQVIISPSSAKTFYRLKYP